MVFMMKRIFAQMIDLLLGFLSIFVTFQFILPLIAKITTNNVVQGIVALTVMILLPLAVQYPFMMNGQTIGKGFFSLKIVSTDKERLNVPVAVVVQREILCKLASCYLICLPLFVGKLGGHEEATHTKLVTG
ncbi:RDD family protein [Enterococcus nangangensis]|uniref:RDD family protein n=1 Tax=Enterococcus nangangensis TaxID=2559926 RepID=UPI00148506AF|nr:RDD family protein [Enterococcus nangangensis]